MHNIDELIATLQHNEEIARKLFEIEVSILSSAQSSDLFEKMIRLIKDQFAIPEVWVTLLDDPTNPIPDLQERLRENFWLQDNIHLLDAQGFGPLLHSSKPMLSNKLSEYSRFIPAKFFGEISSLAVLPLLINQKLIGAVMLGDTNCERYHGELDTFLLEQLSVKVSLCLSNVFALERATYLATRDTLTGLRNRRELDEHMRQEQERLERYANPMALMFIDCNHFKQINDRYGHDYGDKALIHIAEGLNKLVRSNDRVFRFAGDEFVVCLANQTRYDAQHVRERVHAYFRDTPLIIQRSLIPISLSCGIAASTTDLQLEPKQLLKLADENMLNQKLHHREKSGFNRDNN